MKTLAEYMALPYSIRLIPDDDGTWFAEVMELRGCMTVGDSKYDALEMLEDAKLGWLSHALETVMPIPEPMQLR